MCLVLSVYKLRRKAHGKCLLLLCSVSFSFCFQLFPVFQPPSLAGAEHLPVALKNSYGFGAEVLDPSFLKSHFLSLYPSPSSGSPGSARKEQRYRSIMSYWFLFDCRERGGRRKLPCENLQLHFSKTLCYELGLTRKKTPLGCRGSWLRARAPSKRSVCFCRSCK